MIFYILPEGIPLHNINGLNRKISLILRKIDNKQSKCLVGIKAITSSDWNARELNNAIGYIYFSESGQRSQWESISQQEKDDCVVTVHSWVRRKNKAHNRQKCGRELLCWSLSNFRVRSPRFKVGLFKRLSPRILCYFYRMGLNLAMLLTFWDFWMCFAKIPWNDLWKSKSTDQLYVKHILRLDSNTHYLTEKYQHTMAYDDSSPHTLNPETRGGGLSRGKPWDARLKTWIKLIRSTMCA